MKSRGGGGVCNRELVCAAVVGVLVGLGSVSTVDSKPPRIMRNVQIGGH